MGLCIVLETIRGEKDNRGAESWLVSGTEKLAWAQKWCRMAGMHTGEKGRTQAGRDAQRLAGDAQRLAGAHRGWQGRTEAGSGA